MVFLVGCGDKEEKEPTTDTVKDSPISQTEPQTDTTDSHTNEVIEIPSLKTIANQLGISVKDMNILEQKDNHLLFSFFDNNSTIFENQATKLEKDGYQLTLYDGTISSTFVLEKGNQKISITKISSLDDWKKVHQDEMNVNAIGNNENLVYEIINK